MTTEVKQKKPVPVQMSSFWKMVTGEVEIRTGKKYENHNYIRDVYKGNAFNNTIHRAVVDSVKWAVDTLKLAGMVPRNSPDA